METGVLASLPRNVVTATAPLTGNAGLDALLAGADALLYSYQPSADGVQQAQRLVDTLRQQPDKTLVVYYDGRIGDAEYAVLRQHSALAVANMHATLKKCLQESLK
ncbi:MAG: hypothetical protein HZT40_12000 [Candidatus Thiothrix singaporensis]|uniref:Uncharacterized protein n=1 Tax=Candidatus Thiothrix singaporensis TaxID=2799669 RepID=A0A7L6ATC5_9GAMM|nr:MAG: hypothetical protein HZT40_12000 [Candidatus Thiothrix singaporensis]